MVDSSSHTNIHIHSFSCFHSALKCMVHKAGQRMNLNVKCTWAGSWLCTFVPRSLRYVLICMWRCRQPPVPPHFVSLCFCASFTWFIFHNLSSNLQLRWKPCIEGRVYFCRPVWHFMSQRQQNIPQTLGGGVLQEGRGYTRVQLKWHAQFQLNANN